MTVPRVWGRYPDQIEADARREAVEQARKQALKRAGRFNISRYLDVNSLVGQTNFSVYPKTCIRNYRDAS